jgi:hypothetical protein
MLRLCKQSRPYRTVRVGSTLIEDYYRSDLQFKLCHLNSLYYVLCLLKHNLFVVGEVSHKVFVRQVLTSVFHNS